MLLKSAILKFPEIATISSGSIQLRNSSESLTWATHSSEITGLAKFQAYWVTVASDKSLKLYEVSWDSKSSQEKFDIKHKKKISTVCSNDNFIFFGDKTGEIWRVKPENLASGNTESLPNCEFFVGHQASVDLLWCDQDFLVSVDQEHKIKITAIREFSAIEHILLGHSSKIISAVRFCDRIVSCDESGVLYSWKNQNEFEAVKLNEPIKLIPFGDRVLGVSESSTYLVDTQFLQVRPIAEIAVLGDYPHTFKQTPDGFEEIKLKFDLD